METTRHERVILLLLAYTIGFTAAYIWLELGDDTPTSSVVAKNYPVQVVATQDDDKAVPLSAAANAGVETRSTAGAYYSLYKNGELRLFTPTDPVLLSVSIDSEDAQAANLSVDLAGIHADVPAHQISPDGKYVYFCEVDDESLSCQHYVYDVTEKMLHALSVVGGNLEKLGGEAVAHWQNGILYLGNFHSTTSDTPWLLTLSSQ